MSGVFRLAHVTDPHFQGWTGVRPGHFLGKRAAGALNLVLNRGRKHRMVLLDRLREDLRGRGVDHLAVTGDLSNIALEAEWQAAGRWLSLLDMDDSALTVIPGNHDAYVEEVVRAGTFERMFAPFQTAEMRHGQGVYPFVQVRGDVALVGVNTCVPTGDLGAWGEIGEDQRRRLEALLCSRELAGKTRVVLLHHPPVMHRPPEGRNLRDRLALADVLRRVGAELVLHGHDHRDLRATIEGPRGAPIPVVGAGSASYAGLREHRSRYNVYEIEDGKITAVTYSHDEPSDGFRECRREVLGAG